MKNVLVLGATSVIAVEALRCMANDGDQFFLVDREVERLSVVEGDLLTRGAQKIHCEVNSLDDYASHSDIISRAKDFLDELDTVFIAYGTLGDQSECERDFAAFEREFKINFLSIASFLTEIANYFEKRRRGTIVVISSVAGDRGRQSNYAYGTAKGALSIFLEGLRNRLYSSGIKVITIKPGLVDTPMTKDFKKGLLWSTPQTVGRGIYRAISSGKDVAYLPWFWFGIMTIICHIPRFIFKKLKM